MSKQSRERQSRIKTTHRPALAAAILAILGAAGVLGASWIAVQEQTQSPADTFAYSAVATSVIASPAKAGFFTNSDSVGLRSTEPSIDTLNTTSTRTVLLGGTVVDASGSPVSHAPVFAIPLTSGLLEKALSPLGISASAILATAPTCMTSVSGSFELEMMSRVNEEILILTIPGTCGAGSLKVADSSRELRVVCASGQRIHGRITGPTGEGITLASVVAVHPRMGAFVPKAIEEQIAFSAFQQSARTNENGEFELSGLDAGPFTVMVTADGYSTAKKLNVVPGSESVDLQLGAQGQVSGYVFDSQQRPLEGAAVAIGRLASSSAEPEEGDDTTTDANGFYIINAAPAGGCAMLIKVVANGFASQQVVLDALREKEHRAQNFALEPAAKLQIRVVNEEGQIIPESLVEAYEGSSRAFVATGIASQDGMLQLEGTSRERIYRVLGCAKGYALGMLVDASPRHLNTLILPKAFSISGRVLDRAGKPVGKAKIVARLEGDRDEDARVAGECNSNTNGEYTLPDLTRGNYSLTVQASGLAPHRVTPVTLTANINKLDLTLDAGQTWKGSVKDTLGNPVANIQIRIGESGASTTRLRSALEQTVKTNNFGEFEITNVPRETNWLVLSRPGNAMRVIHVYPGKENGAVRDLGEIVWTQGGRIEGVVVSNDGTPMASVPVLLLTTDFAGELAPRILTSKDGKFEFHDVPPGHHALDFTDPNAYSVSGGFRRVTRDVLVAEGATVSVKMEFGRVSRIRGRVRVRGSIPQCELEIAVRAIGTFAPERGATTPDWCGNYELLIPEPGTFSIELRSIRGAAIRTSRLIQIGEGETRSLDLEIGDGAIVGSIVSATTGEQIPNARIEVFDSRGAHWFVNSNVSGEFTIEGLPVGAMTVNAEALGFAPGTPLKVELSAKRPLELKLSLSEGAVLVVNAVPSESASASGAKVTIWKNGEAVAQARTNGFGEAIFDNLAAADYAISVEHPNYEGYNSRVTLNSDAPNFLTINTKTVGSFAARFRDESGNAIPSKEVWITTSTGLTRCSITDASGLARFDSAAEGEAVVEMEGVVVGKIQIQRTGTTQADWTFAGPANK